MFGCFEAAKIVGFNKEDFAFILSLAARKSVAVDQICVTIFCANFNSFCLRFCTHTREQMCAQARIGRARDIGALAKPRRRSCARRRHMRASGRAHTSDETRERTIARACKRTNGGAAATSRLMCVRAAVTAAAAVVAAAAAAAAVVCTRANGG